MVLFQFFTAILLLSVTSVKTYSVPYQNIQLAFSITPKLIYTSESNPALSGYSYATQDFNGGESNVVFTTGADSASRLKNEMNSLKMSEGYSQRDKNQENIISSEQQYVKIEKSKNKQDLDLNIEVLKEEKKSSKNPKANIIEHPMNLQQVSLTDVPYPVFKENLNLHLPVFPNYQISSNEIQSQYHSYNPYAHLELPLHNFDFYNPTVPLFYQAAAVISNSNSKSASTAIENTKASVESHVTESSQTNATSSESSSVKSNIIDLRFNLESTTNAMEETSFSQSVDSMNKHESMITSEKIKEEITTSEFPVTSQNSVEQTTDNKANSTEPASTETNPLTEKSSAVISKECMKCMKNSTTKI
ncbi:PREDICTED: uncharacterized protein LOC105451231 [Wasmannia auropunctata]|uniref:uncharacterized protein LOC105451231 n=1 Tax=Wasmannia auropunctata TaxID=64793 RepID=UPI0005EFB8BF|nr:PREDICTED: uncharacterized protein LOC105451231 [Wasmannia auropunctata]